MVKQLRYTLLTLAIAIVAVPVAMATLPLKKVSPGFATLQAYAGEYELNDPVIDLLNQGEGVTIEFDELADDRRYLRWRAIHCDKQWNRSTLLEDEYLDGYNETPVDDVSYSIATSVPYVHYRLTVPGEQIHLKVSGNYLVEVYDERDPDAVLVSVPVMVTENGVGIDMTASPRTDIDFNRSHQQLSIAIDPGQLPVQSPFNEFTVCVWANDRHDTRRIVEHPLRQQGKLLIYEHMPQLIFPAGNEYRRFETLLTHAPGLNIDRVGFQNPHYIATVGPDTPRAETSYIYDSTQHGRYYVRELNSENPDTEADYILTAFTLESPPLDDNVYLEGELTLRHIDETSAMDYDTETGTYRKVLMLKQGSYNYSYVTDSEDANIIDGNRFQTVNRYSVAVYWRAPGSRHDRLVGYGTITTGN